VLYYNSDSIAENLLTTKVRASHKITAKVLLDFY